MSNYNQIKEKESENTKDLSTKQLVMYINAHRVILFFYSNFFCWTFSMGALLLVPFFLLNNPIGYLITVVFHLISWEFHLKGYIKKNVTEDKNEVIVTIEALKEIKFERK
jgi:hypothetical protein